MRILSIIGARPQFVKAAPICRAFQEAGLAHDLLHTGQHFDRNMSDVFFDELGIPAPSVNLDIGPASQSVQTARILQGLDDLFEKERPAMVAVYGDTTSTLAGALTAAKLGIPIAHIEAGLRSFNRSMPEEINRTLTDHVSDLLFCPSATARSHLAREGVTQGVHVVGDVMFDALLAAKPRALARQEALLSRFGLRRKNYILATLHRPYTVDDPVLLSGALAALGGLDLPVLLPLHPRTRARVAALGPAATLPANLRIAEPFGFLDMVAAEEGAELIATDSGGVQKEAFFLAVPCVTLRPETEWVETVDCGWNRLAGSQPDAIRQAVAACQAPASPPPPVYGDGDSAKRIAMIIKEALA